VSAFAGGTEVGKSEVWSFFVPAGAVPPPDTGVVGVEHLRGLAFDGRAIWVASCDPAGVVVRLGRDAGEQNPGALVPLSIGGRRYLTSHVAFDGNRHVWFTSPYYVTADGGDPLPNNMVVLVDTLRSDTAPVAISVGSGPDAIAFDGSFMWVGNRLSKSVSIINVATRHVDRVVDLGKLGLVPNCLAFDGRYMWVGGGLSETTGLVVRVEKSGYSPDDTRVKCDAPVLDMAFDGSHMWLVDAHAKLRRWDHASASPVLDTVADFHVNCHGLVFDGAHVWVLASAGCLDAGQQSSLQEPRAEAKAGGQGEAPSVKGIPTTRAWNYPSNQDIFLIYELDAETGVSQGSIVLDGVPHHGLFDGTHLWLAMENVALPAGGSGDETPTVVTTRDTLVYYHYHYQAGTNETLCVWLSPPRDKPWRLDAVNFIAGDSASWDTVRGCVKRVPRYPQGGRPLSTIGTLAKEFSFQTRSQGEVTAVSFREPPLATDPERDFLVCWASRRMARAWPMDDTASWSPPRSYRIGKPWGEPEPLAGDLAVVGVFTCSETVDVQVDVINAPTGRVTQGVTVIPQAVVRNNGTQPVTFPVRFRIGTIYMDSVSVNGLVPDSAVSVSFSPWTATQAGTFQVRCTTSLSGDLVSTNNLRVDSVVVVPPDTGGFSIELIWKDGRADLDLYLVLPNRQGTADTVCWKKRQAQGCMLDVDDREGYGPEVISGPVSLATPDSAKVGVHYYGPASGESTQAQVTVSRKVNIKYVFDWCTLRPTEWWSVGTLGMTAFKKFTVDIDPMEEPGPDSMAVKKTAKKRIELRPDLSIPSK
jgi:hypothetical protein